MLYRVLIAYILDRFVSDGPVQSLLHRLSLRLQMGRPVGPGPVAGDQSAADALVSRQNVHPAAEAKARQQGPAAGQRRLATLAPERLPRRAEAAGRFGSTGTAAGTRRVRVYSRIGHWLKSGKGLVPIRRVYVIDCDATYRDKVFLSTDVSMSPKQIIGIDGGRWNIETLVSRMPGALGVGADAGPQPPDGASDGCVAVLSGQRGGVFLRRVARRAGASPGQKSCAGKRSVTFSDMMVSVRRYLWVSWVFEQAPGGRAVLKLAPRVRRLLDFGLS